MPPQSLIQRSYRDDVPPSHIERFLPLVLEMEEENVQVTPCFSDEGINYMHIRHNNLYRKFIQRCDTEAKNVRGEKSSREGSRGMTSGEGLEGRAVWERKGWKGSDEGSCQRGGPRRRRREGAMVLGMVMLQRSREISSQNGGTRDGIGNEGQTVPGKVTGRGLSGLGEQTVARNDQAASRGAG
jgi:hypothetical protein